LPVLFAWLDGEVEGAVGVIAYARDEDQSVPPPSVATWRAGVPGDVRFSATCEPPDRAGLRRPIRLIERAPSPHPRWNPILHAERRRERPSSVPREKIRACARPRRRFVRGSRSVLSWATAAPAQYGPVPTASRVTRSRSSRTAGTCMSAPVCPPICPWDRNASLRQHNDASGYRCRGVPVATPGRGTDVATRPRPAPLRRYALPPPQPRSCRHALRTSPSSG
jgi:hypothetical protein